jgi:protein transport protein SEC20
MRRHNTQTSELSKDEKTVNASTDVTLALRRTHDMMAAELSRSQFAHDTLQESTAALAQLSETYSTLDTLLSNSRNLIGTLLRSQKSDTWYLETAFYVLLTTVFWLIFRRLLYGPTWWLVWLPLKLLWKGSMGILAATGIVDGSSGGMGISSMVGHETAVYSSIASSSTPSVAGSQSPGISVGGYEGAASTRPTDARRGQESVSEQVGRIIEESRNGNVEDNDRDKSNNEHQDVGKQAEAERNPKKRMWEAEKEAEYDAQRRQDEL